MIAYNEKSFEAMKFNPMCKGDIGDVHPELKPIMAIYGKPMPDLVIRYILMVYDDSSVLVQACREITMRKRTAAELSRLNTMKNEKFFDMVLDCSDTNVVKMIVEYLRVFRKPRLWQMIVANEMLFEEYNARLMQKIKENDADEKKELDALNVKTKIRQEVEAINTSLEAYYMAMFGNDDNLKKRVQSIDFSPEGQAVRLK